MEQESVFLSYVRYTFKRWVGFQQAIINGMGGDYANEKETWLGNEVENYFNRYDKVERDEIEDYLGTMIENEFSTYFEDGSLQEVCHNFCIAYPLSLKNPDAEIFKDMRKSSVIKPSNKTKSSQDSFESTNEVPKEQSFCEKMEELKVSEETEDGVDEWTVVSRKCKKSNK